MAKPEFRRLKYEVARRVNRFRKADPYLWTRAEIGGALRVTMRNAEGAERVLKLRAGSTDYRTFVQIFSGREYDTARLRRDTDIRRRYEVILGRRRKPLIIDAGANIGLAAIFFRDRYPEAAIVSIEPEQGNFVTLCETLADDKDALAVRAGIAPFEGWLAVEDPGKGQWGFRTAKAEANRPDVVRACTIEGAVALASEHWPVEPFILKVDIEGFEKDLFDDPATLDRFYIAFVETHDRLLPKQRTASSLLKALAELDRDLIVRGETLISISNADPD